MTLTLLRRIPQKPVNTVPRRLASHFKFVVAGGGSGGCAVASNLVKHGSVAVIDPAETHYYQPMWTLVGAGLKTTQQSSMSQTQCVPQRANWMKTKVAGFDPDKNTVYVASAFGNKEITYDYLVVALGLDIRFDKVKGLPEALGKDGVCSNYGAGNADYTWNVLSSFKSGDALFTFPSAPIKCAGAPQKIMYLADAHLRKTGVRDSCTLTYHTALPAIFGVPKYAAVLSGLAEEKGCGVEVKSDLVEVCGSSKEAVFRNVESGETSVKKYDMLHAGPPCAPNPVYANSPLADTAGWVDVDKQTLQHNKYKNVFAIGDCNSAPTGKTAAKVAAESGVVYKNLRSLMRGKPLKNKYDGYTSCPLTVGNDKLVLAEFGYDGAILETFPFNQAKPRWLTYFLKKEVMPPLYWHGLIRGTWQGPGAIRKIARLGLA